MKLSQLNEDQKAHLAWRLDHKTACGLGTASAVARGDHGDLDLVDVFKNYGFCSPRSAAAHARLTENFQTDPSDKKVTEVALQICQQTHIAIRDNRLSGTETKKLYENLIDAFKGSLHLYKVIDWEAVKKQDEEESNG